jgi:hypothetical protein
MPNLNILQSLVFSGDLAIEYIIGNSETVLKFRSSHQAIKSLAEIYNWTALEENIYQITASKLEEIDSELLSSIIDSFSPEEASAESAPTLNSLNNIEHPLTSVPSSNPVTRLDLSNLQSAMTATQDPTQTALDPDELSRKLERINPYLDPDGLATDSDDEPTHTPGQPLLTTENNNFTILYNNQIDFSTEPMKGNMTIHPKGNMNWAWIFEMCGIEYTDCRCNANGKMSYILPIQQLREADYDLFKSVVEAELGEQADRNLDATAAVADTTHLTTAAALSACERAEVPPLDLLRLSQY